MKKRSEKQQDLDKLKSELTKVSTVILTTFQGITVHDDTKLRRSVQAAGGNYQVVKNTIAERAASGTPAEKLLTNLKGTNSIAYTNTDPVALAKALTKIAKDVPAFQFRAGLVEGRVISIAEIQQLANLPSKDELISSFGAERAAAQRRGGGQRSREVRKVWVRRGSCSKPRSGPVKS